MKDFFRYHGPWAPGVRVFRRMGFAGKAGAITGCFAAAATLLAALAIPPLLRDDDTVTRARAGVAALRRYLPAAHALTDVEQARRAALSGLRTQDDEAVRREAADAALQALAADLAARRDPLGLLPPLQDLRAAWQQAAATRLQEDDRDAGAWTPVALAREAFLVQLADRSGLQQEPDRPAWLVTDAVLRALPRAVDDTAWLWGRATLAAGRPALAADLAAALRLRAGRLGASIADLRTPLLRAGALDATLAEPAVASAEAAVHDLRLAVERVASQTSDVATLVDPATVHAAGRRATAALADLAEPALTRLDGRLAARQADARQRAGWLCGSAAVALLAGAYLFICFRMVLTGGIAEVRGHLHAMRSGDLTTRPSPWGRDEVAELLLTLSQVQASWRGIVSEVRRSVRAVDDASSEVASGVKDVVTAIDRTPQENAALAERTSTACGVLRGDAVRLSEQVACFRVGEA